MAPITTAWKMEVKGRHLGKDSETLIKCMTEKQPMHCNVGWEKGEMLLLPFHFRNLSEIIQELASW